MELFFNLKEREMENVHVIKHPLVQHKLTLLRMKQTGTGEFRTLMREIGILLGYEITRNMKLTYTEIETALGYKMQAPILEKNKTALVPILRAGNGLLDGMLLLLPTAKVGHIGLYRDTQTNTVVEYYFKIPDDIRTRHVIILDPLLATGNSAVAAVSRLKEMRPKSIEFLCMLAAPEGIQTLHAHHPDVNIYTAAIDEKLDKKNYIIPGIGDAGDRLYGTH